MYQAFYFVVYNGKAFCKAIITKSSFLQKKRKQKEKGNFSGLTMIFPLLSGCFSNLIFFPWHPGYEVNTSRSLIHGRKFVPGFLGHFYFCRSFFPFYFCSARIENIMVCPKNFSVGSTSTSDRPCSRFFGLRKVLRSARPV